MSKLPEVKYDDITDGQKRTVDGGQTVEGQFPTELSEADLSAWIMNRLVAH